MKLIAHRGNLNGPNNLEENKPEYIINCIRQGFDCEIDVRLLDNILYLGHDNPDYQIDKNFLLENKNFLWIHCKNINALNYLIDFKELNIFWHQNDDYTLTSKNFIWSYPNKINTEKSILLLPELDNFNIDKNCYGICTDYIYTVKEKLINSN